MVCRDESSGAAKLLSLFGLNTERECGRTGHVVLKHIDYTTVQDEAHEKLDCE